MTSELVSTAAFNGSKFLFVNDFSFSFFVGGGGRVRGKYLS